MLWIFILLIALIAILSYFDEISTQLNIRKSGINAEGNAVVKELEKEGGERSVLIYKLVSIIGFAIIGWYIYNMDAIYFYGLCGIIILAFLFVIVKNMDKFQNQED